MVKPKSKYLIHVRKSFSILIVLARARARARDRDRDLDLDLDLRDIAYYLKGNLLLVNCLNTECYVSKEIREKILNELLTLPADTK